jgi:hypothetical protein
MPPGNTKHTSLEASAARAVDEHSAAWTAAKVGRQWSSREVWPAPTSGRRRIDKLHRRTHTESESESESYRSDPHGVPRRGDARNAPLGMPRGKGARVDSESESESRRSAPLGVPHRGKCRNAPLGMPQGNTEHAAPEASALRASAARSAAWKAAKIGRRQPSREAWPANTGGRRRIEKRRQRTHSESESGSESHRNAPLGMPRGEECRSRLRIRVASECPARSAP